MEHPTGDEVHGVSSRRTTVAARGLGMATIGRRLTSQCGRTATRVRGITTRIATTSWENVAVTRGRGAFVNNDHGPTGSDATGGVDPANSKDGSSYRPPVAVEEYLMCSIERSVEWLLATRGK